MKKHKQKPFLTLEKLKHFETSLSFLSNIKHIEKGAIITHKDTADELPEMTKALHELIEVNKRREELLTKIMGYKVPVVPTKESVLSELENLGVKVQPNPEKTKTLSYTLLDTVDETLYTTFTSGYVRSLIQGEKVEKFFGTHSQVINLRELSPKGYQQVKLIPNETERLQRVLALVKYRRKNSK